MASFYEFNSKNSNSSSVEYQWPFICLFIIPLFTIWGNALVCVSVFIEKRLQNRFNFFLVSLAISDLLCALLVMPVSAWNMVNSKNTPITARSTNPFVHLGNNLTNVPRGICLAWYSLDVFFTSTTIIHLCSISLDRYFVLNNPLKYHNTHVRSSLPLKIAIAWLIPFCIACPLFIFALHLDNAMATLTASSKTTNQKRTPDFHLLNMTTAAPQSDSYKGCGPHNVYFIIIATVITFVLPLIIMIVTYILTVCSIIRQTNQARQNLYPHDKSSSQSRPPLTHIRITDDSQSINETTNSAENVSYSLLALDDSSKYCSRSSISINSFDSPVKSGDSFRTCHRKEFKIHLNVPTMEIRRSFDFSPKPSLAIKKQFSLSEKSVSSFRSAPPPHCYTSQPKSASSSFRLHKQSRNSAKRTLAAMNSGKKAVQVLGILFGLFLLCYLPFFVVYLLDFFCTRCQRMTGPLVPKTEWIGYSASMLNPIVYHIFNPTFRNTFNRLMRGECYKVRKAFSSNTKSFV